MSTLARISFLHLLSIARAVRAVNDTEVTTHIVKGDISMAVVFKLQDVVLKFSLDVAARQKQGGKE
jgi:hypothetical protein